MEDIESQSDHHSISKESSPDPAVCLVSKPLQTERLGNGRRKLLRELEVCADGASWRVPQGMETDYSSIPAVGRSLVRWSRVDIAGVVHDALYLSGALCSRARSDRIWRVVAQAGEHAANPFQAWVAWAALRGFGGIAWAKHRGTTAAWVAGVFWATISSLVTLAVLAGIWSAPWFWVEG